MPNGLLDSSFGTNGIYTDTSGKPEQAEDVAVQQDGKLVVCGAYDYDLDRGIIYSFIARFHPDGRPDLSFGVEGEAIYTSSFFLPNSIAIQEDGKIVAAGNNQMSFALVRYLPDGTLDSSFGVNGEVITDFDKYADFIQDILIQPDGKIVAAGAAGNNSFNQDKPFMGVARYNTDGSLDKSFGEEGKANIKFQYLSKANALALQQNDKIVIAGYESNNDRYFAIASLEENGFLDSSFGINGKTITDIGTNGDQAINVGIQKDGRIIAGGQEVTTENVYSTVLVGYHGDPVATNPLITRINSWIQDNLLGWYSTNSSNVNYYSIQYSKNGSSFTEVKRVPAEKISAAGREPSANAYRYVLSTLPTDSYYRIAAIQQDGSKAYSEVVYYPGSRSAVSLYPNPVQDVLTVTGLTENKPTTIQLVNRNGHIISAEKIHTNTFTKNIQTLQSGVYYIRILTSGNMQTLQFVKE